MCGSCHLDMALNVEISVENQKILLLCFFNVFFGPFKTKKRLGSFIKNW